MRHATVLALLLLAVTAAAQPAPPQPQGPPPQAILHDILQLDESQMKAIEQLGEKRRQAVEPLAQQLGPAQQALGAAINATPADPAAVGKAMLAIRDLQRQIEQAQKAFAEGFSTLLTDAQRAQVQQIRNVEAALHAAEALHGLGL